MSNFLVRALLDPVDDDRDRVARKFQFPRDNRSYLVPLGIGAVMLLVALVFGLAGDGLQQQRFMYSYLIGWTWCLSITIGGLFFVMINHVVKARWMIVLRRIAESIAMSFPMLFVAGLPIILSPFISYDLYHWADPTLYDPADSHFDTIIAGKAGYFYGPMDPASHAPVFFALRYVVYFGVFILLSRKLYSLSIQNDTQPSAENTKKLVFHSAWGIPIAAVFTAFAGFDYLMTLDPHWFSTIFGVYFFAGGWLSFLALLAFLAMAYNKSGILSHEITKEHVQDVGKLMFGFTVFWTYIGFSQYFLIWYANIPEEVVWYQKRMMNGWEYFSIALIAAHFIIPFFVLLPRFTKRFWPILATMCVWILVMHWFDHMWLALPTQYLSGGDAYAAVEAGSELIAGLGAVAAEGGGDGHGGGIGSHNPAASLVLTDVAAWLGLAGLWLGAILWRNSRHAVTPYNDPYFHDSLKFENV
ncbi:MAG: hypothetical protein AAF809_04070 [Bacteroidota bacterium]